jgi:hypothetical protein
LTKSMEDQMIGSNGAVVNSSGSEFAPLYLDGFNPRYMMNTKGAYGELTSFINVNEVFNSINQEYE